MSPASAAVRAGLERGWIQFRNIVTTPDGIRDTVLWNGIPLLLLILNRNSSFGDGALSYATVALPGLLGMMIAYGAVIGPAYLLSAEREDGTLLRFKSIPHGMRGYVTGVIASSSLESLLSILIVFVPGLILFDVALDGALGLVTALGLTVLGLLGSFPLGIAIGSLASNPRSVGGLGMLALGGLSAISGIFFPIQDLWGWLQTVAQIFPMYWLGLGMRSAFLPDAAAAAEIGGSWRTLETFAVLGVWAAAGLALAPPLLRRTARRESGSSVVARRDRFLQRTG